MKKLLTGVKAGGAMLLMVAGYVFGIIAVQVAFVLTLAAAVLVPVFVFVGGIWVLYKVSKWVAEFAKKD